MSRSQEVVLAWPRSQACPRGLRAPSDPVHHCPLLQGSPYAPHIPAHTSASTHIPLAHHLGAGPIVTPTLQVSKLRLISLNLSQTRSVSRKNWNPGVSDSRVESLCSPWFTQVYRFLGSLCPSGNESRKAGLPIGMYSMNTHPAPSSWLCLPCPSLHVATSSPCQILVVPRGPSQMPQTFNNFS